MRSGSTETANNSYTRGLRLPRKGNKTKYSEVADMVEKLLKKGYYRLTPCEENLFLYAAYQRGMEDIIRILCDKGVIDNSEELEREREGGF